jgi:hypothetical protein
LPRAHQTSPLGCARRNRALHLLALRATLAGFENSGDEYCAPTAVSNSLMWLANHGYRNLKPNATSDKTAQIRMIKQPAASDLMNTNAG